MMELLSHNASSPDPLHQEVIYKRPLAYQKMENMIKEMQDPEHGVPVRSQKLFLTSIPAAFAGYDIIEWLMERLSIEDSVEAIHLANLLCQHGYFFPVGDNRNLTVKDDSSLYRFQTPYYWPSQVPCLDSVDYAIYLAKRTLRNKQKHGLDDYEIEALNTLRKTLAQKWDFISMQADEQVRISKERKKVDKMVTDSQERAFWRVIRPPPGSTSCVETPPMHMADFHANEGVKQIRRTNIIEDLRAEVDLLRTSCLRSRSKVSQALESLSSHSDSYNEHDSFLVPRQPSNPWVTEDLTYWIINAPQVEVPTERRAKKWAISMEDLVFDPTGLRELTNYLQKEYCNENIRFWLAVRDLRYGPASQIRPKASQIYNEFLSPGAPCEINIDMRTMDAVQKEMNYLTPSRFTFDPAANHVYAMLLKKDCYPRFIRSEHYKGILANALQLTQKKRFFSFAAPIKKKSSATNPLIFPIGSQSATAGVGEVLKAADEVILITTGNRPGDFMSSSHNDADKLSAMADCPYRGDMIPDLKGENKTMTVRKALSQSSFDDVCPWESMEKLPEKEISRSVHLTKDTSGSASSTPPVTLKAHHPLPPSTSAITKAAGIISKLTSSTPALACPSPPSTAHPKGPLPKNTVPTPAPAPKSTATGPTPPLPIPALKSTVIGPTPPLPTPAPKSIVIATSPPTPAPAPKAPVMTPSPPVQSPPKPPCSTTPPTRPTPGLPKQESVLSNSPSTSSRREDEETVVPSRALSSSASSLSSLPPPPKSPSMENPDQNQNLEKVGSPDTLPELESEQSSAPAGQESGKNPAVEVCPWDHENGSQPESTTFTKTYSTLGYL